MTMTRLMVAGCFLIAALFTNPVDAQFSDNFDSYTNGQNLHGVNGWKGWNNDSFAAASVTAAQFSSEPHSVAIGGPSDLVNELGNPTSGCWQVTIDQYIPTGLTGNTYFIMLSRYSDSAPFGHNQWSVQLNFQGGSGMMVDDFDGALAPVPIVFDQWVEIKMIIDLDKDTLEQYYNGVLLNSRGWMMTGVPEIGCVDLYSANASQIYYDNFVLQLCPPPGPVIPDSVTVTRGVYVSGDETSLADSDNFDLAIQRLDSDVQSRTEFEVVGTSPIASPTSLEVTLEGAVFARSTVVQSIELWDYVAGAWELVDTRDATNFTDSTATVAATGDLSRFVDSSTLNVQARIHFQSPVARQRFASNTDQFVWFIQ